MLPHGKSDWPLDNPRYPLRRPALYGRQVREPYPRVPPPNPQLPLSDPNTQSQPPLPNANEQQAVVPQVVEVVLADDLGQLNLVDPPFKAAAFDSFEADLVFAAQTPWEAITPTA